MSECVCVSECLSVCGERARGLKRQRFSTLRCIQRHPEACRGIQRHTEGGTGHSEGGDAGHAVIRRGGGKRGLGHF